MFAKEDYLNYFGELESIFKEGLIIYTDLLNDISDQAIRNKLFMLAAENMDTYNFIIKTKEKFI